MIRVVTATLLLSFLWANPTLGQGVGQPLGKVVTRKSLVVHHHLDDFDYCPYTDTWYSQGSRVSLVINGIRRRPVERGSGEFVAFDSMRWSSRGQDPVFGETRAALRDGSVVETGALPKVDTFVSIAMKSDAPEEARIYVRQGWRDHFDFVCRGTDPSSGSRGTEQNSRDISFCYLNDSLACVWQNGASRAIDSAVDSIVWTSDRRHIVYARQSGEGHDVIAYSIADDDYSVLISIRQSSKKPLLFRDASDGIFLVTAGTEVRNLSLPLSAKLPQFRSPNQIPLLYRSVAHEIQAVSESGDSTASRGTEKQIRIAEWATADSSCFEVMVSVSIVP